MDFISSRVQLFQLNEIEEEEEEKREILGLSGICRNKYKF